MRSSVWIRLPRRRLAVVLSLLTAVILSAAPLTAAAAGRADLVVSALSTSATVLVRGTTFEVTLTTKNQGTAFAKGSTGGIYLTSTAAPPLGTVTPLETFPVRSLGRGAGSTTTVSVGVPPIAPGSYYLVAQTDVTNVIAESHEGNNRRTRAVQITAPDLVVSALSLSAAAAPPDTALSATVTIRNQGTAAAGASAVAVLLASTPVGALSVPALGPGASATLSLPFRVPAVAAGSHPVAAGADSAGVVAESHEDNNRRSVSLRVEAPAPPATSSAFGVIYAGFYQQLPWEEILASLDAAARAGARSIRMDLVWGNVEYDRGEFYWDVYDQAFREARIRGLEVVATFYGSPYWAVAPEFQDEWTLPYPPANVGDFERFVGQAVARYKDLISHWEIWNEPDGAWFWKGTPGQYAQLLAHGYAAVKAADPSATVLLGGLAQGGGATTDFLEQILDDPSYPAGANFDIMNYHTNFRSPTAIADQIVANRELLAWHGLGQPHWVTETSYTSELAYQGIPGYQDGEAGQARYLVDAYAVQLQYGVERIFWAFLKESAGDTGEYAHAGLVTPTFAPKPAFFAYQELAGSP